MVVDVRPDDANRSFKVTIDNNKLLDWCRDAGLIQDKSYTIETWMIMEYLNGIDFIDRLNIKPYDLQDYMFSYWNVDTIYCL